MTFRGILALLCAGGSIAAGLAAACSSSSSGGPAPVNQAATDTIPIAAVLSLTGSLGYLGGPEQDALRVAVNQINALGGVAGKNLAVTIVDDASDPNTSQTAYNNLMGQKPPVALIGPTGSPAAVLVQAIALQSQTIDITPSASTPILTDAQPAHERFMFRTAASHELQAKALAKWMAAGPPGGTGCRHPAVIYQDDAFGAPIAADFEKDFLGLVSPTDGGITPGVLKLKVPATAQQSYKDQVNSVVGDASIDCQLLVLFQGLGKQYIIDFANVTNGQAKYGFDKFTTLGCNALQVDTFISTTRQNPADPKSPTYAEGMWVLNFDTNPSTPEFGDFRNLFTAQRPLQPGQADISPYTGNIYDAVILVALAIEAAGGADDKVKLRNALFDVSRGGTSYGPSQVADALAAIRAGKDVDYKGASGDVDFDEYGDVLQDFVVFQIKNGAFQNPPQKLKASSL